MNKKTLLTALVVFLLSLGLGYYGNQYLNPVLEEEVFYIDGLACDGCAVKIERELLAQKGIKFVDIDAKTGETNLSFNPKKISLDDIVSKIEAKKLKVDLNDELQILNYHLNVKNN